MQSNPPTDVFSRSVEYWLRRAQRCLKSGNLRSAAGLARHAARFEPRSEEASLFYATVLRELHCYEASNREASSVLARNCKCVEAYGMLARNLISLGRKREALDVFSFYLSGLQSLSQDLPMWDEVLYNLEEKYYNKKGRACARFHELLKIAASHMSANDCEGAKKALEKSGNACFPKHCAERERLLSLFYMMVDSPEAAVAYAISALRYAPRACGIAVSAATVFHLVGERQRALTLLLRAAALAHTVKDEFVVCVAAEELHALPIALQMLLRNLKREPNRVPACYNLSLCMFRSGMGDEALQYIHLCRELDPQDIAVASLFQKAVAWSEKGEEDDAVAWQASEFGFYGVQCIKEQERCLALVKRWVQSDVQGFCKELCENDQCYQRCLLAFSAKAQGAEQLLPVICEHLSPKDATELLYQAMLLPECPALLKRVAVTELIKREQKPPFVIWQNDRIVLVNPTIEPPASARLMYRLLFRRVAQAARYVGTAKLNLFALERIRYLTPKQRVHMANDRWHIWSLAIAMRCTQIKHYSAVFMDISAFTRVRAEALLEALQILRKIDKKIEAKEKKHGLH
ncbi:MAG: hypothetical protein RSA55_04360 [Clostridia bacterium]